MNSVQEAHQVNIDHVRQVLMNELGLTRDGVREIMREIAAETAQKYINSGALQKTLDAEIYKQLLNSYNGGYNLKRVIGDAVAEAVKTQIVNAVQKHISKLTFEMTAKLDS